MAFVATAFFVIGAIIVANEIRLLWRLDAEEIVQLKRGRGHTSLALNFAVAIPVVMVWLLVSSVGSITIVLYEVGVSSLGFEYVMAGTLLVGVPLSVLTIAAAFYGWPSWALLPAFRSRDVYERYVRNPS